MKRKERGAFGLLSISILYGCSLNWVLGRRWRFRWDYMTIVQACVGVLGLGLLDKPGLPPVLISRHNAFGHLEYTSVD